MSQDSSFSALPIPDAAAEPSRQTALRGQWLGFVCLMAFASMTWLPTSYFRMFTWPWVLVWQIGFLSIGIWLLWQLRQSQVFFLPLGYGLDWAVALTGLSLVICSLATDFKLVALWNILFVVYYAFALYSLLNWARQTQAEISSVAAFITGIITVTAVISLAFWRPSPEMWQAGNFNEAIRNFSPFGQHNFVGGYFALAFPFVLSCAFALQGWQQWVARVGVVLVGSALYISGSRGALVGLVVWLIVAIVVAILSGNRKQKQRYLAIGASSFTLGIALLFSNPRVRDAFRTIDFSRIGNTSDYLIYDGPVLDRYFMLKTVTNILSHKPLTGVGPGVMSRVYDLYRPITTGSGLSQVQQLHNTPAQLLGEMGLLGLATYLLWLVLVSRLWWKLWRQTRHSNYRWLAYGIGGSYLAYGVSSLTDYQLENIGIASLLLLLLVLLILVADNTAGCQSQPLGKKTRRSVSLLVFTTLVATVYLWLIADIGFAISNRALKNSMEGNLAPAINQWSLASAFAPWDPTYNALAAQQIYNLLQDIDAANQEAAQEDTVKHLQAALNRSPNDKWFNFNLASLLLDKNPEAASIYASRAIQLLPRSRHFSYYFLGQSYLNQGRKEDAITAFILEALKSPKFLVMDLWNNDPYSSLKTEVLSQTLKLYDAILADITPDTRGFEELYNQAVVVRWWHQKPLPKQHKTSLSPVVQTLLAIDESNQKAMALVNQFLSDNPDDQRLKLLKAWLNSGEVDSDLLAKLGLEEQEQIKQHLYLYRDIRSWLGSLLTPPEGLGFITSMGFTYRNGYAQKIHFIAQPAGLETPLLADTLELFKDLPREFPLLDQTMEAVKQNDLGLPSAVNNNFALIPKPSNASY